METYFEEKRVKYNVTQCKDCSGPKGICHDGCAFGNGEDKQRCCAMNDKGNCDHCGCHWTRHTNSNIVFYEAQKAVVYDVEELKKQHGDAFAGMSSSEILLRTLLEK